MKFRKDFIEIANIDPLQYITIASVCMGVYRSKFMPSNEIAVVKDVKKSEVFSEVSIKWIKWISETQDVYIQHALNGGEHKIQDIGKIDGYCETTNTVYEFQGCFWHGCPKCYSQDTINPYNQIDMGDLHEQTKTKNKKITDLGYNLVEMFECDLKNDNTFKKWSKNTKVDIVTPLNPRDAFFGGRTNISKLKYDFKDGEKGRYVDFVSLYPTVQFFKKYPVGHPTKIFSPETFDPKWFGLRHHASCIILCYPSERSAVSRRSCCSLCVARVERHNSRVGVTTTRTRGHSQELGAPMRSTRLSRRVTRSIRSTRCGTSIEHQRTYSRTMSRSL
jgi:G:T-mismatch repair DNA endonuclease (very short patch repair protein)